MRTVRVYIQQNCIPHYREALFEVLSSKDEVEFTVIADSEPDTPFMKVVEWDTSPIRRRFAKTQILKLPLVPALFWQPGAIAMVVRERPDLIIALGNPYSMTTWALLLVARFMRIPSFLWGHGLLERESGAKWFIRKILFRLADGQMLYGDFAKKLLTEKGFASDSLHVVFNSLDYEHQASIAKKISSQDIKEFRLSLGLQENERLVIFIGRLQAAKRVDLLLQAIAHIALSGRHVHVALIGDGGETAALRRLAQSLGLDRLVHFYGAQYDEQFLGLALSASDLCVVPSSAGLSVIHAMAFGNPCIIHDQVELHGPEWEAVKEGMTGFFYRNGDTHELSKKIEQALFPISCKVKMSEACQAIVRERYNPHRQARIIVDAVRQELCHSNDRRNRNTIMKD